MNARQEYERLTVELHREIRAGRGDAEAADSVRDRMDGSWRMLSSDEQNILGLLSEDLYELAGDRQLVELAADENVKLIAKRITGSYTRQPARTLALLRKLPDDRLPGDVRAYMMGQCWAQLGFHYAATEFFDHAYSLTNRANYAIMALSAVVDAGDSDELHRRITEIEKNSEASPALCLHAGALLFQTAQKAPEPVRPSIFRRVITLVGRGTSSPDTLPSLRATALVAAGFSYEHLSQRDRALASLDKAINTCPNDSAYVARALLRLASDREAALTDFREAVERQSPIPWPYAYLAHDALVNHDYERAETLADEALRRTQLWRLRAELWEWSAIAAAQLKRPSETVQERFRRAIDADPLNERIQRNAAAFKAANAQWQLDPPNDDQARRTLDRIAAQELSRAALIRAAA